jgi:molybdopterin converting factor small subunit
LARVVLRDELRRLCGTDAEELIVGASDIRQLIRALDVRFPGAGVYLKGHGMAVAIDGVIHNQPLAEPLQPDSEVCFMPMIRGG